MQKLLLVDHSPVLRGIQIRVLREAQIGVGTILEASTADEALALLAAHPDVGAVLCDARIAAGGRGLVDTVRRREGADRLPFVLLSAWDAAPIEALDERAPDGCLRRPFTSDAVRELLAPGMDA